jgi:hypothetical protein
MSLPGRLIQERGNKETLPRDHPLEAPEQAAARRGLHLDSRLHIHHRAHFRAHALPGIEFDFHKLHVIPDDLVVDNICHSNTSSHNGLSR